jgi:hypothetical protein
MRKALLIAVTVATVLVAAGPATASYGRAAPAGDYVIGGGTIAPGFGFALAARSGPSGEFPTGSMAIYSPGWLRLARVTCMVVSGSHAQVSGPVYYQSREGGHFPHQNAALIVVDDMPWPTPDRVTFTTFAEDLFHVNPDTACIFPTTAFDPLLSGNVIVHDE